VEETDAWVRMTARFRKIDKLWQITHEHVSVCKIRSTRDTLFGFTWTPIPELTGKCFRF